MAQVDSKGVFERHSKKTLVLTVLVVLGVVVAAIARNVARCVMANHRDALMVHRLAERRGTAE